jgi:hypothetical protein
LLEWNQSLNRFYQPISNQRGTLIWKKLLMPLQLSLFLPVVVRGDRGQLVGVKGKKWHPEKPYGMTLCLAARSSWKGWWWYCSHIKMSRKKLLLVTSSIWMNETEITNAEYRKFHHTGARFLNNLECDSLHHGRWQRPRSRRWWYGWFCI